MPYLDELLPGAAVSNPVRPVGVLQSEQNGFCSADATTLAACVSSFFALETTKAAAAAQLSTNADNTRRRRDLLMRLCRK